MAPGEGVLIRVSAGRTGPAHALLPLRWACWLVLLVTWSCGGPTRTPVPADYELETVPVAGLDRLEPGVRTSIDTRLREVESLAEDPNASPAALGGAYGRLGQTLHAYELYTPAIAAYRNATLLAPVDYRWWHYLGRLLYRSGRLPEATLALESAARLAPGDIPTAVALARVQKDQLLFAAAEATLRQALTLDSEDASALLLLAELETGRGNPAAAVEWYELLLRLQPAATRLYAPLASAYRDSGRTDEAAAALRRQGDGPLVMSDPLLQELGALRSDPQFHMGQGIAAFNRGDYRGAAVEFGRAAEMVPDDPVPWTNLGSALAKQGDLVGATEAFERALALAPDDAATHFNLGILASRASDIVGAESHYRAALVAQPAHRGAAFNLANLLRRQGEPAEALAIFSRLLEQNPGDERIRQAVAVCLAAVDRPAEALETLREGLAVQTDSAVLIFTAARLLACSAPGGGEEAVALSSRLVEENPSAVNLETQAMALAAIGRYAESIEAQESAISAALRTNRPALVERLRADLERYRRRQPCSDPRFD